MNLSMPVGDFEAYIFDCDGTLADSMMVHYEAWAAVFSRHGIDFDPVLYYELGGMPARELIPLLGQKFGVQMSVEETVQAKEMHYLANVSKVTPIHGVIEIARKARGTLPMAVASGGGRPAVTSTLKHLGILDWFEVCITSEDVAQGKPAPDCFLKAAMVMGVRPDRCLVFEDAPFGIAAAEAAGMVSVLVPRP